MLNRASQVKNCTTASCFIAVGIDPMPWKISRKAWPSPALSRFIRLEGLGILRRIFAGGQDRHQATAAEKDPAPM
jgi:hypothetical protein